MQDDLIVIGIAPGGVQTAPVASSFGMPSLYPLFALAAVVGPLCGVRKSRSCA
jgi:hypothetical protein